MNLWPSYTGSQKRDPAMAHESSRNKHGHHFRTARFDLYNLIVVIDKDFEPAEVVATKDTVDVQRLQQAEIRNRDLNLFHPHGADLQSIDGSKSDGKTASGS